jgi:hypothetical protein
VFSFLENSDRIFCSMTKRCLDDMLGHAELDTVFPAIGEDKTIALPGHALVLHHGTSLRLMASCSAFLNASQEFSNVDPEGDWKKWSSRVPDAFTLYYSAIVDPTDSTPNGVHCVLCAVLDGWSNPAPPHNRRLIIDYVASRVESRRLGLASTLVRFARESASELSANLYVLAIEDSCAWWIDKGFILEDNTNLNARLKVFPDVHLLRKEGENPDEGSADDLSHLEKDEEESEEEGDEGDEGEEGAEEGAEDYSLQMTLQLSTTDRGREDELEDDAELKAAIGCAVSEIAKVL